MTLRHAFLQAVVTITVSCTVSDVAHAQRLAKQYPTREGDVVVKHNCIAFSLDGKTYAAAATRSNIGEEVVVRRCNDHAEVTRFVVALPGRVRAMSFSPGGESLVAAGVGGVSTWNSVTGKLKSSHENSAIKEKNRLQIAPDCKAYIAGNKVFSVRTGSLRIEVNDVNRVALSPDGRRVVGLTSGRSKYDVLSFIHARTGRRYPSPRPISFHIRNCKHVSYTPDGTSFLTIGGSGRIGRYDSASGDWLWSGNGDDIRGVSCLAPTPDGHKVVTVARANRIRIYDATTGFEAVRLTAPVANLVAVATNNKTFGAVTSEGGLLIWEMGGLKTKTEVSRAQIRQDIAKLSGNPAGALAWLKEDHRGQFTLLEDGSPNRISLHRIHYGGSDVTDDWLALLENFPKLRKLDLHNSKVTDVGLQELGLVPELEELSLSGTRTTDRGIFELTHLKRLRQLNLERSKVTDAGLEELAKLEQLTDLTLSSTTVTDEGLGHLESLELKSMSLSGTGITNAGLQTLSQHKTLERLGLSGTRISDDGLRHLAVLPRLKSLSLGMTSVSDAAIVHIANHRSLESLRVVGTRLTFAVDDVEKLMNLRSLDLESSSVNDEGLRRIGKLIGLEEMILINTNVGDAGLEHLSNLKNLRKLYLRATKVTPQGIEKLKRALPDCDINQRWLG